jgi:hypothetical protein
MCARCCCGEGGLLGAVYPRGWAGTAKHSGYLSQKFSPVSKRIVDIGGGILQVTRLHSGFDTWCRWRGGHGQPLAGA